MIFSNMSIIVMLNTFVKPAVPRAVVRETFHNTLHEAQMRPSFLENTLGYLFEIVSDNIEEKRRLWAHLSFEPFGKSDDTFFRNYSCNTVNT